MLKVKIGERKYKHGIPCKNYLKRKEEQGDLVVMDFPPQLHNTTIKDTLRDVVNQYWNKLKPAVLKKRVHSMPNRVLTVFKIKSNAYRILE